MSINVVAMIVIVRERCMNFGQGKVVIGANLVNGFSEPIVPDGNVLDGNTAPGNVGLPPEHAGSCADVPVDLTRS